MDGGEDLARRGVHALPVRLAEVVDRQERIDQEARVGDPRLGAGQREAERGACDSGHGDARRHAARAHAEKSQRLEHGQHADEREQDAGPDQDREQERHRAA